MTLNAQVPVQDFWRLHGILVFLSFTPCHPSLPSKELKIFGAPLACLVIMVRHRTISKYVERKCQGISINAAFDSADPLVRNDEPIWSGESCGVLAMGFKLIRR